MNTKTCTKCGEAKPTTDFHRNRTTPDGFAYWCKTCLCAKCKESRQLKLDHYRAMNRAWNKAHRDKVSGYIAAYHNRLRAQRDSEITA